ncbi:hypothetical protein ACS3SW_07745 [Roseobacteraceae bacterium S113]
MSSIRITILSAALLISGSAALHAGSSLHQTFAGCVGRLSAEMEYAWLMGEDAEDITHRRLTFLSLLDATMPADAGRDTLRTRIEAKAAQSALLTQATFGQDESRALRARLTAQTYLNHCAALLLES